MLVGIFVLQISLESISSELLEEIIVTIIVTILLAIAQKRWRILSWLWKRLFTHSITLNATAIIRNPQRTRMLMIFNPKHGKWLPPGGHVIMRKGEIPHHLVKQRIKTETGFETEGPNPQVEFDGFHDEERTMTVHGHLEIKRMPQPRLVLYEQQPQLPCHCKWHYDLFYLFNLDDNEEPHERSQYERRWFSKVQIHELVSGQNPRTYSNVKDLADEFLENEDDEGGVEQ